MTLLSLVRASEGYDFLRALQNFWYGSDLSVLHHADLSGDLLMLTNSLQHLWRCT